MSDETLAEEDDTEASCDYGCRRQYRRLERVGATSPVTGKANRRGHGGLYCSVCERERDRERERETRVVQWQRDTGEPVASPSPGRLSQQPPKEGEVGEQIE